MTRIDFRSCFALPAFVFVLVLAFAGSASAQQAQPSPVSGELAAPAPSPAPPQALASHFAATGKGGKLEYAGPTTVVELPPAPMLDEEGKQRQDPSGKLMFNPPIRQQRDKKGNPLFDEHNQPVMQTKDELGFDERGKKIHAHKEKQARNVSVAISRGTLTVDGLAGKAALNYEIQDLKYIYFYVPWIGTTVVSTQAFPGATEQKGAFDDKTLTVKVGDHILQLSSDARLLGKKPESAFVLVDKAFSVPTKFPVMGYGPTHAAPYAWPGSKENQTLKSAVAAPPLPETLRPALLLQPCPEGQMRKASPPALPGRTAAPQPCAPIVLATAPKEAAASTLPATAPTSNSAHPGK